MEKNETPFERVLRIVFGIAVLSLLFLLEGNNRYFGLLGIIPIINGSTGVCPVYTALGINRLRRRHRK